MQYLICEKISGIVEMITDNVSDDFEKNMFLDTCGDCYYSYEDYIYYDFPNDDIPKYVRSYEYRYSLKDGFQRTMTRDEMTAQKNILLKAAKIKSETLTDMLQEVDALKHIVSPTFDTSTMTIEEYKAYLIAKSKDLLETFLKENPITSTAHGGVKGTYSVTQEKQTLMTMQYATYQIEKAVNPNTAKITWNETGEECEEWAEEEFLQLIMEIKLYVYPIVSYQQSLEKQINNCTTKEELDEITIDYSKFNV